MSIKPSVLTRFVPLSILRCFLRRYLLRRDSRRVISRIAIDRYPSFPSPFLIKGWDLEAGPTNLPEAFLKNRVHGMTQLQVRRFCHPNPTNTEFDEKIKKEFLQASEAFSILSCETCSVIQRYVKGHDEDPWWPTSAPSGLWDGNLLHKGDSSGLDCECFTSLPPKYKGRMSGDLVRLMIKEAHDHDMLFIAYHRIMAECHIARDHEAWLCKQIPNPTGPPPADPYVKDLQGGYHLNIANPEYRDIVLQRLKELAERNVDAFNFDSIHMPANDAWNEELNREFNLLTHRSGTIVKDWNSADYREYLDFVAYKVEETFAYWKREIKGDHRRLKGYHPNIVFSISTTWIPALSNRRMTTNLARIADVTKNEYLLALNRDIGYPMMSCPGDPAPPGGDGGGGADELGHCDMGFLKEAGMTEPPNDIRMAAGWVILRDAADGRPPRIWAPNFANVDHTLGYAASLLAYGAIANLQVSEEVLNDALRRVGYPNRFPATPADAIQAAFALGSRVSPALQGTLPLRWAAIHFSELARNGRGAELLRAWNEVLLPFLGAFEVFVRRGLPVGIVTDYHLHRGELDGIQVIFLPNPEELTKTQRSNLERFIDHGGIVLGNEPFWGWESTVSESSGMKGLGIKIDDLMECSPPPVQVIGGGALRHAVAHLDKETGRIVVAVTNDFTFVQPRKEPPLMPKPRPASITDAAIHVYRRPGPTRCTEVARTYPPCSAPPADPVPPTTLSIEPHRTYSRIELPEFCELAVAVIEF